MKSNLLELNKDIAAARPRIFQVATFGEAALPACQRCGHREDGLSKRATRAESIH